MSGGGARAALRDIILGMVLLIALAFGMRHFEVNWDDAVLVMFLTAMVLLVIGGPLLLRHRRKPVEPKAE